MYYCCHCYCYVYIEYFVSVSFVLFAVTTEIEFLVVMSDFNLSLFLANPTLSKINYFCYDLTHWEGK